MKINRKHSFFIWYSVLYLDCGFIIAQLNRNINLFFPFKSDYCIIAQRKQMKIMYNAQLTYDRIDEMAKLRGISIGKINEICSLSKNAISNAAKSEYGMKAKNIVLISEILDVSTDYLLGRTDNPTSSGNNIIQSSNVINGNNGNHSPLTVTEPEKENNCKEIEALLEKMPRSKQLRAIADIIDLLEEKYQEE